MAAMLGWIFQKNMRPINLFDTEVYGPEKAKDQSEPLIRPLPVADFGHILTVLADIGAVVDEEVADLLTNIGGLGAKGGHTIDDVLHEVESVQVVEDDHIKRRGGGSLFFVAANVKVLMICPTIGQPVDKPRIAVEGKDDGFIPGEQGVERGIGETMRMFG